MLENINEFKVSIIVAIYKSENFLKKCIESIINQTYSNLEIILVDDGSPDNSGCICDEYAKKDNRITVIHKENGGTCEARNVGLQKVTGDYIVIVDGDDWLSLDYVEYMMKILKDTKADMAMTDCIFTTRDQNQVKNDTIEIWSPEKATAALIYPIIPIGPWNKIYSTSLIKTNNITFSVPWSGEGLYFTTTAAQYSKKVGVGHRKVYNYRLNNLNSGLTNYNLQMGINALRNIKFIGNNLIIKSSTVKHAVDWHIWKNYNYLLFLLVATNSISSQKDLYYDCLKNIRSRLIKVVFYSDLGIKTKLKMIYMGIFPVKNAKQRLKQEIHDLTKDKMK